MDQLAMVSVSRVPCISTLDFKSGYWQVTLYYSDKEKKEFVAKQAVAIPSYTPFLLQCSSIVMYLMETVLRILVYEGHLVYPNNVIVVGQKFQEQPDNL
jgi:hypothetical protein